MLLVVVDARNGSGNSISKPNVSTIVRSIRSDFLTYTVFLNSEIFEDHFEFESVSSHILQYINR